MCWQTPLVVLLAVTLAGCKTSEGTLTAVSKPHAGYVPQPQHESGTASNEPHRSEIELASAKASSSIGESKAVVAALDETTVGAGHKPEGEPTVLTLEAALPMALERNPDLAAMRAQEPVSRAACGVAETYPFNPYVQVQVLPYTQEKDGGTLSVNNYVLLMQTLELAHQRRYREANAYAALNQVRWNIVQAELLNVAQTERIFFAALYQRQIWELAKSERELSEKLQQTIERRVEAGQATVADAMMARVTSRSAKRRSDLAEANYQTALLALRQQLNLPVITPIELVGDLTALEHLGVENSSAPMDMAWNAAGLDADPAELAANRPDVLAARAGIDAANANADLAQAAKTPNLQIGPFYERDESGTVMVGLRSQMDLPVWNTGEPLAHQRRNEHLQQRVAWEQLQQKATLEVHASVDRYRRAQRLLAQSSRTTDGIADELAAIQRQFEAGQTDVLTIFATQRSLLQDQRTYLDLLNELAQAAAGVTQATGLPPEKVLSAGFRPESGT